MKMSDKERFLELRKRVFKAIEEELAEDGYCKSYEGTFEILVSYPDYFDIDAKSDNPNYYSIRLHCYVLGGGRHYEWHGLTFKSALDNAEKEINGWLKSYEDGRKLDVYNGNE